MSRSRAGLFSLFAANVINAVGSKMSLLAVPWLVLVTTGSPVHMGLVGLAQTLPYIIAGIVGTPLVDRFGMRPVSILNDVFSAVLVAGIALFAQEHFGVLLALATLMGTVQGVGDRAKRVLLQPVAETAGVSMPRVVALFASFNRVNTFVGLALGGVIIAWIGPIGALWVDAASYAACATLVSLFVRVPAAATPPPAKEAYAEALRNGFGFLRNETLLRRIVGMMLLTNLFNQASAVILIPLWVMHHFGSPIALGWIGGAVALGGILGNVAFVGLVHRLPRYLTFILGYLLGGSPRFLVLGLTDDLRVVLAVTFLSGIASSVINPVYGTLLYERVPRRLQARVFGLTGAIVFGGVPVGGLVGAWFVEGAGLQGALILSGILYFTATLSPIFGYRVWKQMDDPPETGNRREPPPLPRWVESMRDVAQRTLPTALTGLATPPVVVRLSYASGTWKASARHGLRRVAKPRGIASGEVVNSLKVLELPDLTETVEQLHAADLDVLRRRAEQLRAAIAAREALAVELGAVLRR